MSDNNKPSAPTKKPIQNIGRFELPTIFAERLSLTSRDDKKYIFSWLQQIGDVFVEQSRVMVDQDHLIRIIDLLCKQADYYPQKKHESNQNSK